MDDLITPERGPGICPLCLNFTLETAGRCRACRRSGSHLSTVVPISYAAAGGCLHRGLADYKRAAEPAVPYLMAEIVRILSRFLSIHESCVARAAGVSAFDSVVIVPSSDRHRNIDHPLRRIVAERVQETAPRYREVLAPGALRCTPHTFDRRRFVATVPVRGHRVLLIDDVWTTGASAQSAAAALRDAGATAVAAVVVGRYVNGSWGGIAGRLRDMEHRYRADACVVCSGAPASPAPALGVPVADGSGSDRSSESRTSQAGHVPCVTS